MTTQVTTVSSTTPIARHNGRRHPRRRAARIAGISYLAMFVLAIFANFVVREGLVEPGNSEATVANITESIGVFRLGVVAFAAIFVLDVVVAWALHIVFRDVDRGLSLGTAWFRLTYSALLGVGVVSLFLVIQLVDGSSFGFLTAEQMTTQTMVELASFEATWLSGLVAFGIHLVLLGVLVVRSGLVTRVLGYVLVAAGIAYVLDTAAQVMLSDYQSVASIMLLVVALPSMVGEGWLGLWLLLTKRFQEQLS